MPNSQSNIRPVVEMDNRCDIMWYGFLFVLNNVIVYPCIIAVDLNIGVSGDSPNKLKFGCDTIRPLSQNHHK